MTTDHKTAKFEKFMETTFEPKAQRFIERLAKDAENRPMIANIGFVIMALLSLHSLSAAPAMWMLKDISDVVPQTGSYLTIFVIALAVQAVAAFGLYRAKAYGMYAVALSAAMDVVTSVVSGAFILVNGVVCGILFYFLWMERAKFSKPSLPDQE